MKCLICGSASWIVRFSYGEPDKYEKWQKITDVTRSWLKCSHCGFYTQTRNYPLKKLEAIYQKGYRDAKFRGQDIEQAFKQITELPYEESENRKRLAWFTVACGHVTVLDVGSGLGVWPALLNQYGIAVSCVETNTDSIWFLTEKLGLTCFKDIKDNHCAYQVISLIHLLEHIEDPDDFLNKVKRLLLPGGELFIEVPDASEFNYLDKDHDEFNSTHVYFYNICSLSRLLERNGFIILSAKRMHYKKRKLTRLIVTAGLNEDLHGP